MSLILFIVTLVLFVLCILGYITGHIASKKDYSFTKWFCLGCIIFPWAIIKAKHLPEPDYFTLHRSSENKIQKSQDAIRLYSESFLNKSIDINAPLDIIGYDLYERENKTLYTDLTVRTHRGKTITSLIFTITELDSNGNELGAAYLYPVDQLQLVEDQTATIQIPDLKNNAVHQLHISVKEAFYEDHTSIINEHPCWTTYTFNHPADLHETLAMKKINKYAQCYPQQNENSWICACGQLNKNGNSFCSWCGIDKERIFTECTLENLSSEIKALQAETEANALKQKEIYETKNKQEEKEIQNYQKLVESRRARFKAMILRRKKAIIIVTCTILVLFFGGSTVFKIVDDNHYNEYGNAYLASGESEMAHDAYVHAWKSAIADDVINSADIHHTINVDQEYWIDNAPEAVESVPDGAFICDVVDDLVFYRQTSDGMDKTVYVKTIGESDEKELFTYDEKAQAFVYCDGCFAVLQKNRVGNSTLLMYNLSNGKTVSYNFGSKAVALTKTCNNQLAVFFVGSTWPENYFVVSKTFYGNWSCRRITKHRYNKLMDNTWYNCRVLESE